MVIPTSSCDPRKSSAACEVEKRLPHLVAVQVQRFVLIIEAHQAFVTRHLATGFFVFAGRAEMARIEDPPGHRSEGVSLLHQAAEHGRAALCCLVKENRAMLIPS